MRLNVDHLVLTAAPAGTRLRLRVKPGAARNAVVGVRAGALKLTVTAAPERGRANRAVLALLARTLDLAPSALDLVAGSTSPDKTVVVPLSAAELRRRLSG